MPSGPPARICQKSKIYSTGSGGQLPDAGSGLLFQHVPGALQRNGGGIDEGRVGGPGDAQIQCLGEGFDGGANVPAGEVGPAEVLADGGEQLDKKEERK